jgi:histidinol-phosphate/aromatic aminotransferase/cobyric acid decarboxylase-like protein
MAKSPRPRLVVHGGAPADWLDFSANPNPLGVPAEVRTAIDAATYERYADLNAAAAERHLAADAGLPPSWALVTAGATEALRIVADAWLGHGRRAIIAGPTYGDYRRVSTMAGAEVIELRARPKSFRPPVEALVRALSVAGSVVFVCDPNNPTGCRLTPSDWRRIHQALVARPSGETRLVIDQSFAAFAEGQTPVAELLGSGRVVLVRSLTKRLGTPGVRVGYILGPPRLLAPLRVYRDPWSVGAHALAAARSAAWVLTPTERRTLARWRRDLSDALRRRGLRPLSSTANFILVEVGAAAPALVAAAARRRIAVRSGASFGLSSYVRLAVRPPAEQARLLAAIDAAAEAKGELRASQGATQA